MKTILLCGGLGTRIRDVAENIPKPMIPIGELPILWHIQKYYASWGHTDFVICLGYMGDVIKQFFLNYRALVSDFSLSFDAEFKTSIAYHNDYDITNWRMTFAETGLETLTGTRVARVRRYVADEENFMLTYGDGLSDVNIDRLLEFHRAHGKILTVSGVRPPGRFGEMEMDDGGHVVQFNEKPQATGGRINGGFFVCRRELFDYVDPQANQMFEEEPIRKLVRDRQLMMYQHDGFWQCMDTNRDYLLLNALWRKGTAPWHRWR